MGNLIWNEGIFSFRQAMDTNFFEQRVFTIETKTSAVSMLQLIFNEAVPEPQKKVSNKVSITKASIKFDDDDSCKSIENAPSLKPLLLSLPGSRPERGRPPTRNASPRRQASSRKRTSTNTFKMNKRTQEPLTNVTCLSDQQLEALEAELEEDMAATAMDLVADGDL